MSQQMFDQFERDKKAVEIREQKLALAHKLRNQLSAKYGEDEVEDLAVRECEITRDLYKSFLKGHLVPDGTLNRILGLFREAWEKPRPTDFPKGSLQPKPPQKKVERLGVVVLRPEFDQPAKPKKAKVKVKRVSHAQRIENYYRNYSNLPSISAEDAREALLRLQQPGGSILPDYKPDS